MRKKILWLLVSCVMAVSLVLASCGPAAVEAPTKPAPTKPAPTKPAPTKPAPTKPAPAEEEPQYGGTFTPCSWLAAYDPTSWDPNDAVWNTGFFNSFFMEDLMVGDLEKYGPRGSNEWAFQMNEWTPYQYLRGCVAESWELPDPLTIVFKIRKGIYFHDKPGVMAAREVTADDVEFCLNRYIKNPKYAPDRMGFADKAEVTDKDTVAVHLNYFHGNWPYLLGWGQNTQIYPPELVDAGIKNWKNAIGTGPFILTDYVKAASVSYEKNPDYWDTTTIDGKEYKIPFVDRIVLVIIKDESTRLAALRSGKVDINGGVSWKFRETLEKTNPELLRCKILNASTLITAMRMDTPPFDDIRVRRAMNMAVDKEAIGEAIYGGEYEMLGFPYGANWPETVYTPLEKLPESARELYEYNPEKAKELLAEAGYPDGFKVVLGYPFIQDPDDLVPMAADYWAKVGVECELQTVEYGTYISMQFKHTHPPMWHYSKGVCQPIAILRMQGMKGGLWDPQEFDDPYFTEQFDKARGTVDQVEREKLLKELQVYYIDQAPNIAWPEYYYYRYAWPWVKNYYFEHNVGTFRTGQVYARLWLDQNLKKEMGY